MIIANGKRDNILPDLLKKDSTQICTRFIPSSKSVSSVKKWIAHSEGFAKGELHLNGCAQDAVFGKKAVSILPVGVIEIKGEFEANDIVKIFGPDNNPIGVGKVSTDSKKARELMGKKGEKPFVHYDYLYLD